MSIKRDGTKRENMFACKVDRAKEHLFSTALLAVIVYQLQCTNF